MEGASHVLQALGVSLRVAAAATALVAPPALALGWLLARRSFRGKSLVETVVALPLVLPPTAVGYLLLRLFGRHGPLGREALGLDLDVLLTWRGAVLAICPYSIPPFTLAISICGLRGILFGYDRGDCRDYPTWLKADEGDKPEQTFLAPETHQQLLRFLDEIAQTRRAKQLPACAGFREEHHVYFPLPSSTASA